MRGVVVAALALALAAPVHLGALATPPAAAATGASVSSTGALPDLEVDPEEFIDEAADLPNELVESLARDVGLTGSEFLAEAELAVRAGAVVDELRARGVGVEASTMEDGEVVVIVENAGDEAAVESLGIEATTEPAPTLDVSDVDFTPAADLHGGAPTYYSGFRCSAGFSGVATATGASESITAGHCLGGSSDVRLLGSMAAPGDDSNFEWTPIGTPVPGTYRTGEGWDFGRFAVSSGDVTARPSVLTWGGGTRAPTSSSPLLVRDAAKIVTSGSTLCKSGSSSGWSCGTIVGFQAGLRVGPPEDPTSYLVDGILACVTVIQGDSGGSALVGSTAVGVTSAVGTDATGEICGTAGASIGVFAPLYSPYVGAASAQTLYGSSWEPMIAVARPTISSFSGTSPVFSGDVLSGTVPFARTRHRVEVVIDGGAVRKAGIAADGTWSVDISDLAVGEHTYTVRARWGARSVSSKISGSWTTFTAARIAGANRFDTAARISQRAFPDGARTVFIANGLSFPDALSAGPAAALLGGPVLLTAPQSLPAEVATELKRLDPDRIVIVGGAAVVSTSVAQALRAYGSVERWSGADRYATSREIARRAFRGGAEVAYLATGAGFPDALSAGAAGVNVGAPVILVPGTQRALDASTVSLLRELGVQEVRIAGGTGVVSSGIATSAKSVVPTVRRLAGADRYATSLAINANVVRSATEIYLTSGTNFPDALAGSVLAGLRGAPMYISASTCVDPRIVDHIAEINATRAVLLGGSAVLGSRVARLTSC